jgi:hypothetical protein
MSQDIYLVALGVKRLCETDLDVSTDVDVDLNVTTDVTMDVDIDSLVELTLER